ncbi:YihY/virulence factor BrkB family protein [Shinella oryzae]|uniref:YihY/virulence factor BrkB family protein n=1 Tax=Shinella oryzae TaxID=2871820 RepID=UPI001FF22965|nr:YihY/virulence factor BrkB family protein [Shinella oryzae]
MEWFETLAEHERLRSMYAPQKFSAWSSALIFTSLPTGQIYFSTDCQGGQHLPVDVYRVRDTCLEVVISGADQISRIAVEDNEEAARGRFAEKPAEIPALGLMDVLWRVVANVGIDRVTLIAAGVTYYLLLALFPALTALVSLYGVMSDPSTISRHIGFVATIFPPGAFDIITQQLEALAQQNTRTLSFGVVTGFIVALWSVNNAMKALFEAMNIAYGEDEKRGFLHLQLMSLGFTLGALIISTALITAVGILPVVLSFTWTKSWAETFAMVTRWPALLLIVGTAMTIIYRYGPSREHARLRWITWGVAFSTTLWLAASIGFSFYLENFADYNATYGTLGALIGFMVWIWISVIILILGAELNAELEHQTCEDTTTGPPEQIGLRGAHVADTLGEASEQLLPH